MATNPQEHDSSDERPEPVLGVGAAGDPQDPAAGAPGYVPTPPDEDGPSPRYPDGTPDVPSAPDDQVPQSEVPRPDLTEQVEQDVENPAPAFPFPGLPEGFPQPNTNQTPEQQQAQDNQ